MRIEIFRNIEELSRIKKDWDVLYQSLSDTISPFSSYDWHELWWRHYSAGEDLQVLALWDGGRVVGIAPLMLRRANMHGLPVRAVCFIENNQSFICDFIVLPEFREVFLERVLDVLFDSEAQRDWDLLYLNKLSVFSENYLCLQDLLEKKGRAWKMDQTVDARQLVPEGEWAEFFATRTPRTRKTLRNIRNTLQKTGRVSVRHIRTWTELSEAWEDVCRVAQGSWTETTGESLASPANIDFFRDLAIRAAEKGWLSVWTLSLNGTMIAIEFHLRDNRKAYAMRGHFLTEFSRFSPGTYLEMQILQQVFEEEERLRKYDLGNFYSYKQKWTDTSEPHMAISVFNHRFYSRLVSFHEMKAVPALRRVLPQSFWESRIFKIIGLRTAPFSIRQS